MSLAAASVPMSAPHPLLTAPMVRTILRIAAPTTLVMIVQTVVGVAEMYVIGRLGTAALAGFQLVFPFLMLMTMMAAGGIGGGVAASVARALGAGDRARASILAGHALIVGAGFAALWLLAMAVFGESLLGAFGARGETLRYAVTYATVAFAGTIAPWAMFILAAILRGTGDAATPGKHMMLASILQIPLSAFLVLGTAGWGLGGWEGMGIAGAAVSMIATMLLSTALMARRLWRGAGGIAPTLAGRGVSFAHLAPILKVGLISSLSALFLNITTMLVNLAIRPFGDAALAGYGVGARLEFTLVPLAFGIGTALTTLVGMAAGAGDWRRARSVAWVGAGMAAALTGALGLVVALVPHGWAGMFSGEPVVIEAAVHYLTRVAPFYGCIGFGMAMSFASQGANRQGLPLAASVVRLCIAGIGGYLCVAVFGADLPTLFWMLAAAIFLYAAIIAGSLIVNPWGPRRR